MLNIATIGPSLYAVELLGGKKWMHIPYVSLLELTIFGATISAIDPVSVSEKTICRKGKFLVLALVFC